MAREEDIPVEYDPVTGLNKSGYTQEESKQIEYNAQLSRERDPERGVWSQQNITATKLIERAQFARFQRDNGHGVFFRNERDTA